MKADSIGLIYGSCPLIVADSRPAVWCAWANCLMCICLLLVEMSKFF